MWVAFEVIHAVRRVRFMREDSVENARHYIHQLLCHSGAEPDVSKGFRILVSELSCNITDIVIRIGRTDDTLLASTMRYRRVGLFSLRRSIAQVHAIHSNTEIRVTPLTDGHNAPSIAKFNPSTYQIQSHCDAV